MKPDIMMIFAAGRGTRMKTLTDDCPKPLLQVNGYSLLDRIIDKAHAEQIKKIVINTCYKADMIEHHLQTKKHDSVIISREQTALETGGGALNALPLLLPEGQNGFFAVNADPLWIDKTTSVFEQLAQKWNPDTTDILLALIPKKQSFGDVHDGNYFIENNKPRRQRQNEKNIPYLFTGIQILHPRIFDGIQPGVFSLRKLYDTAEQNGRLDFILYDGDWYHVGTPEALSETEKKVAK